MRANVGIPTLSLCTYLYYDCLLLEEEEAVLLFHPKCLYADPPSPIECDWLQEFVTDRGRLIEQLVRENILVCKM